MGGDGDPANGGQVSTGPFRYDAADPGSWRIVPDPGGGDPGPGLSRTLGRGGHLPTQAEVDVCAKVVPYDSPKWNTASSPSFRNQLEGWNGDPNLHNNVHVWVGGSMLPGTSPNDPVFFLHHCNVDRLWWQWQGRFPDDGYVPTAGGPPGHNLNDRMTPFDPADTPAGVLDVHALGYMYDTDPAMGIGMVVDRSTFGQDEVNALAGGAVGTATPARFAEAFWVVADGYTPADLGLNAGNLNAPPNVPTLALSPAVPGMTATFVGPVVPENPNLPPVPQRFRFGFQIEFTDPGAFGFGGDNELVDVLATMKVNGATSSATGLIELVKQADPYMLDGPTNWLSVDLRVFKVPTGTTRFGEPMGTDAPLFIQNVLKALNTGGGTAGGESFDTLSTDEAASALALTPTENGATVYNFAMAKVRIRGLTTDATDCRVFFRLFQAQSTNMAYDRGSTYRRFTDGIPGGHTVPLPGVSHGEYVTIPCFATPRVDTATASMATQTDPTNVRTIVHDPGGGEVEAYFGVWLDTNQPGTPVLPAMPPVTPDGPFNGPDVGPLQSIQQAIVRSPHQCLVAEIAFDPIAIPLGADPAGTDKLSQRNLAWVKVPNPGVDASRRAPQPIEVRPTQPAALSGGAGPDELMIDWRDLPRGSTAEIFLPWAGSDAVLALADRYLPGHRLTRVDAQTVGCPADTVTYVPVPAGTGAAYAGLLTVDVPRGVTRGEQYTVKVRQTTPLKNFQRGAAAGAGAADGKGRGGRAKSAAGGASSAGAAGAVGTGSADGAESAGSAEHAAGTVVSWRRTRGAIELDIPVGVKTDMLPDEERTLSVLRWIEQGISPDSRWNAVFRRYLDQVAARVDGLGGDSQKVPATPDGQWHGASGGDHGIVRNGSDGHGRPASRDLSAGPGRELGHDHAHDHGFGHGFGHDHDHARGHDHAHRHDDVDVDEATGKVAALIHDRFGDFAGFVVDSAEGERHFHSREPEMARLIERAWARRLRISVIADENDPDLADLVILREPAGYSADGGPDR